MKLTKVEKRFLVLHYYLPVPLHRFQLLLKEDPHLENYHHYSSQKLAYLLNLSHEKALALKKHVQDVSTPPLEQLYAYHDIFPIPFSSELYPKILFEMIDPPAVIYAKGDIKLLKDNQKVAIIGARKATNYTKKALTLIVPPLVKNDIVIVSGIAQGADTFAHRAAIYYGGKTIAVLGHGLFHIYPKENESLSRYMSTTQLLITEYPPYVRPERWTFPMRNRIISGLSQAVIVTESKEKSGTMSTVDHALEHGKNVFAVPGPITSVLSEGPNQLIGEGASPISNGFQVIQSLKK